MVYCPSKIEVYNNAEIESMKAETIKKVSDEVSSYTSILLKLFCAVLLVFPFLLMNGCNEEDEMDIFVGRTWKISNLFNAKGAPLSPEKGEALAKEGSFYIKFETETTFIGRTQTQEFNGTWSVDLKKRTISLRFREGTNPADALSLQVIEALQRVVSYEGDYNFLKLKEADSPAYVLCR